MPSTSFLDKYRSLGSHDRYNSSGTTVRTVGRDQDYVTNYLSNVRTARFESNPELASEVLSKAGPSNVYYRPGYHTELSNVAKIVTDSSLRYDINNDPDPVRIVRPIDPVSQRQTVRVRYLEPPNPPTPAPIIVKERQMTPPPPAPPILIRQHAKPPPTPEPLVIREKPPTPPEVALHPTIIEKIIPAPSPAPRQVIIERIPAPEKPREVIYEKWLPYNKPSDRQVIVEKAKIYEKPPPPKNVIIEYENPRVNIQTEVYDEGILRADPAIHTTSRVNGELRIVDKITDLPVPTASSRSFIRQYSSMDNFNKSVSYEKPIETQQITEIKEIRPKSINYSTKYHSPWQTTYRTSYTGKGFGRF